jgi:putative SOS response-associated peptidase YedK
MCGRFLLRASAAEIAGIADIPEPVADFAPRYNIAPMQDVVAVRFNPATGRRSLDALRWGLVPLWAKDPSFGARSVNARAEGIETKPTFREAFAQRRCLIPVSGFYEWRRSGPGKTPYVILPKDGGLFFLAGLWERWRDPTTGEILRSCTIITCPPNPAIAPIHDRMPVIPAPDTWRRWLGEIPARQDELLALLRPCPADAFRIEPVGTRVNNVRNDDPSLIDPMRAEGGLMV